MSKNLNTAYNISNMNTHLLNILDSEYYIELGTISLQCIDDLLQGKVKNIRDCIDNDIVADGTGKISDEKENEFNYQLNHLLSYHNKSSANKLIITCGTVRYNDDCGREKYAPLFLIPISYNPTNLTIYLNGRPNLNSVFRRACESNQFFSND